MPFWGSIFHFPAIVFHYFHENCPQSDSKLTLEMHKIIKIYWENECFLKINLNIPKGNTQWSKAISKWPKIIRIYLNWPQSGSQVTPNYLQNDPNVAPEARSYAKDGPKVAPKFIQSHPRMLKLPQSDAKVPPSHPRMPKVCSTYPQSHPHTPEVIPKWSQSRTEMAPKSHSYAQSCPKLVPKRPRRPLGLCKCKCKCKFKCKCKCGCNGLLFD